MNVRHVPKFKEEFSLIGSFESSRV